MGEGPGEGSLYYFEFYFLSTYMYKIMSPALHAPKLNQM